MWHDLYQTDWPTPGICPLCDAVEEYRQRCDAFDAIACTGRRKGEPVPATAREQAAITRNAINVREDLLRRYNLTRAQFQCALRMYPDRT